MLDDGTTPAPQEPIFKKGQSKRIWNELYKVELYNVLSATLHFILYIHVGD